MYNGSVVETKRCDRFKQHVVPGDPLLAGAVELNVFPEITRDSDVTCTACTIPP